MSDTLYTYYDADAIEVFPSSNAKDKGKLTSEDNLHNITVYAKIKDHVYTQESFNVSLDRQVSQIELTPGVASANGYIVNTTVPSRIPIPNAHEVGDRYKIVLRLAFDESGHVKGDDSQGAFTEGVSIEIWEEDREPVLNREYIFTLAILYYNEDNEPCLEGVDGSRPDNPEGPIIPPTYVTMADEIGAIDIEDNYKVKSLQELLNLISNRYVSRILNDFKYNSVAFVNEEFTVDGETQNRANYTTDMLGNATQYIFVNNDYIKLRDNSNDIEHNISNSRESYNDIFIRTFDGSLMKDVVKDDVSGATPIIGMYQLGREDYSILFDNEAVKINHKLGPAVSNIATFSSTKANIHGVTFSKLRTIGTDNNSTLNVSCNLDVSGDVTANRVFSAVYNDYAELYEKSNDTDSVEPGDVISLLPDGRYGRCTERNSNLVVGVCSDSYGHLLGGEAELSAEENLKKYIPIGISGRVKVKCVTEDVIPGDLLVSSEYAGYAMVNNFPAVGTVIGKALSTNKNGLVTIQIMLM